MSSGRVAGPVWKDRINALTVADLHTLQDSSEYVWTDQIPVKPNGGEVFLYATSERNKRGLFS
jgi:hypothetical protein